MDPSDFITERERVERRALELCLPFVDLDRIKSPDKEAVALISSEIGNQYRCIPLKLTGNQIWVAVDHYSPKIVEELEGVLDLKVNPCLCMADVLDKALYEGAWWQRHS